MSARTRYRVKVLQTYESYIRVDAITSEEAIETVKKENSDVIAIIGIEWVSPDGELVSI